MEHSFFVNCCVFLVLSIVGRVELVHTLESQGAITVDQSSRSLTSLSNQNFVQLSSRMSPSSPQERNRQRKPFYRLVNGKALPKSNVVLGSVGNQKKLTSQIAQQKRKDLTLFDQVGSSTNSRNNVSGYALEEQSMPNKDSVPSSVAKNRKAFTKNNAKAGVPSSDLTAWKISPEMRRSQLPKDLQNFKKRIYSSRPLGEAEYLKQTASNQDSFKNRINSLRSLGATKYLRENASNPEFNLPRNEIVFNRYISHPEKKEVTSFPKQNFKVQTSEYTMGNNNIEPVKDRAIRTFAISRPTIKTLEQARTKVTPVQANEPAYFSGGLNNALPGHQMHVAFKSVDKNQEQSMVYSSLDKPPLIFNSLGQTQKKLKKQNRALPNNIKGSRKQPNTEYKTNPNTLFKQFGSKLSSLPDKTKTRKSPENGRKSVSPWQWKTRKPEQPTTHLTMDQILNYDRERHSLNTNNKMIPQNKNSGLHKGSQKKSKTQSGSRGRFTYNFAKTQENAKSNRMKQREQRQSNVAYTHYKEFQPRGITKSMKNNYIYQTSNLGAMTQSSRKPLVEALSRRELQLLMKKPGDSKYHPNGFKIHKIEPINGPYNGLINIYDVTPPSKTKDRFRLDVQFKKSPVDISLQKKESVQDLQKLTTSFPCSYRVNSQNLNQYSIANGYTFKCPANLHFREDLCRCDWPQQLKEQKACNFITDPQDRGQYAYSVSDAYAGKVFKCPAGLHFNEPLCRCDWPNI